MSAAEVLQADVDEDVLLADEAAKLLRLHPKVLYQLVNELKIPHFRIGPRRIRFRRTSLVAWMASQETGSRPRRGR